MQNLKEIDYTKKRLDDMYVMMYTIKNDLNINVNIESYKYVKVKKL